MTSRPPSVSLRLGAAALLCVCLDAAQAFDLTVEVQNAKPDQGSINGAVYASEAGWLKDSQMLQGVRQPAAAKTTLVYRNLPAGSYAVSVFQDENGNSKLDSNPMGIPIERYGFTREARGVMGPPRFADAVIELQADTTVTVKLQ